MDASIKLSKSFTRPLSLSISAAFQGRAKPELKTDSDELSQSELASLLKLAAYEWTEVPGDFWEANSDVISWLSPASFCYYLPSILVTSVENDCPNLAGVHSLFFMLDRSPDRALWDSHFEARWGLLNKRELAVVQEWLGWLSKQSNLVFDDTSFIRADLTIDLLMAAAP